MCSWWIHSLSQHTRFWRSEFLFDKLKDKVFSYSLLLPKLELIVYSSSVMKVKLSCLLAISNESEAQRFMLNPSEVPQEDTMHLMVYSASAIFLVVLYFQHRFQTVQHQQTNGLYSFGSIRTLKIWISSFQMERLWNKRTGELSKKLNHGKIGSVRCLTG